MSESEGGYYFSTDQPKQLPTENRELYIIEETDRLIDHIFNNAPVRDYNNVFAASEIVKDRPDCTISVPYGNEDALRFILSRVEIKRLQQENPNIPAKEPELLADREAKRIQEHETAHLKGAEEIGWKPLGYTVVIVKDKAGGVDYTAIPQYEQILENDEYTNLKEAYIASRPNPNGWSKADQTLIYRYLKDYANVWHESFNKDPFANKAFELRLKIQFQLTRRLIYLLQQKI